LPNDDPSSRALIQPRYFRKFFRAVSRRAYFVFNEEYVEKVSRRGDYNRSKARRIGSVGYLPGRGKDDFAVVGPAVGAPASAVALEFLAELGCREVVCFGVCGAVQGRYRIGATVVPERAISEEGTSGLYFPGRDEFATDPGLSARVRAAAERAGLSPKPAIAWTTDGLFTETPEKVEHYRQRGCHVVDMELSAMAAVAERRGVKLAALWVVSDELFAGRWKPGFLLPRFRLRVRKAIGALLSLREAKPA
jgi:purine-nucleoside phosphorylase